MSTPVTVQRVAVTAPTIKKRRDHQGDGTKDGGAGVGSGVGPGVGCGGGVVVCGMQLAMIRHITLWRISTSHCLYAQRSGHSRYCRQVWKAKKMCVREDKWSYCCITLAK